MIRSIIRKITQHSHSRQHISGRYSKNIFTYSHSVGSGIMLSNSIYCYSFSELEPERNITPSIQRKSSYNVTLRSSGGLW